MLTNEDDLLPESLEYQALSAEEINQVTRYEYLRVAQYRSAEAHFEAATAKRGLAQAENDLRISELHLIRTRNATRPSMMMGAMLTSEEAPGNRTIYSASAAGLTVSGESPDIAFQNFDREWTQGKGDE